MVIGGGPTGVELAGAIGEMSRFTLARDFRKIDAKLARVILIEAGQRILPTFTEKQSSRATRDLETLGVQVWTQSPVTKIDASGVETGKDRINAATVVWAAVFAGLRLPGLRRWNAIAWGRLVVNKDLSLPGQPNVFIAGDQASAMQKTASRAGCCSECHAARLVRCVGNSQRSGGQITWRVRLSR